MFSYSTPKWKYRISYRQLSIFFTAVYLLSLVPMLILAFYDWPSADDFTMALEPHLYFLEHGGILGTIWASLKKSWLIYSRYEGYFFSIILTCICPSVFGEGWYVVTPYIILGMLTFGVKYFFDSLFVKVWKLDKDLSNAAAMVTLILMVQCLPMGGLRAEAFYWYSGAINYTFTFGMAFFWLGLLMRSVYESDAKVRKRKLIWAAFWGFWMGGANYMTALELGICSVLILFIFFMIKKETFKLEGADEGQKKSFGLIWIPAATNLLGFACSCFTPGNLVRSSETEHIGALKSVLLSLHSTFDMMIGDMLRWETLVAILMLIPVFWKMGEGMKQKLQHPVLFTLFSYLLVSSNLTPPFFAVGNIAAGRLKALAWMEFALMLVLVTFYITVWARQNIQGLSDISAVSGDDADETTDEGKAGKMELSSKFSEQASAMIILCIAFILFGSALCVKPNYQYYCATSALSNLLSGNAKIYREENLERLEILQDDSIKDAVLQEHTSQPEMLFYWDVTRDASEWVNGAVAKYYFKDSTVLEEK